jgi:hypothetical protein
MNATAETSKQAAVAAVRNANLAKARQARLSKRAAAAPPPAVEDFGGLTIGECSFDCQPDRCVITRTNHCGHPCKGGLQATEQRDPEIVARYNRARRQLAHAAVDRKA